MSSPQFVLTNNATMDPATYKGDIDQNFAAIQAVAAAFQPYPQASPNMTINVAAGNLFVNAALVSQSIQTIGTITAPTGSNKRIDRVVINQTTGAVSVITGTPTTGTPTPPAIPSGYLPCAQIGTLLSSTTQITAAMITDERAPGPCAGKNSIWVPAGAMQSPNNITSGSAVAGPTIAVVNFGGTSNQVRNCPSFDPSTANYLYFSLFLPKSWNLGTLTYAVEWANTAGGSGNVVWALDGAVFNSAGALNAVNGTTQEITSAAGTANYLVVTPESSALTLGGTINSGGSDVNLRFWRDAANAADTYGSPAYLLGVRIFYTTNAENDA